MSRRLSFQKERRLSSMSPPTHTTPQHRHKVISLDDALQQFESLTGSIAPNSLLHHIAPDYFNTLSEVVRGIARRRRISPALIEDLVQTAWARVLERFPHYRKTQNALSPKVWFFCIVN